MDRDDATGGRGSEWSVKPSRRITPEEVQAKEFGTARVRVGYLMHEVDEFLDQITDTLSALIAENERLRSEASGRPPFGTATPAAVAAPSDARERESVEAFLQREKAFLQSLGSLVQGHAEELKAMVRATRAAVPAAAAAAPVTATDEPVVATDEPVEAPIETSPADASDREADDDPAPVVDVVAAGASDEGASGDPSPDDPDEDVAAILDGDEPDARAIETIEAEEPIRVDEPQPARSRRTDEGSEGSLRELFWGEE